MMKKLVLLVVGVLLCISITACGTVKESKESGANTESETEPENMENETETIVGMWQTVSIGYAEGDSLQPMYYVQFTDSEVKYGHLADGAFSLDHADKIESIEKLADGRYRVQAETVLGIKYTYQTSEGDPTIMEYYETWEESEFPAKYSGSASLMRCTE